MRKHINKASSNLCLSLVENCREELPQGCLLCRRHNTPHNRQRLREALDEMLDAEFVMDKALRKRVLHLEVALGAALSQLQEKNPTKAKESLLGVLRKN